MSFGDRLKKNAVHLHAKHEHESPCETATGVSGHASFETQSLLNYDAVAATANPAATTAIATNKNPHQFLFSPMKRLRLAEDVALEKPSFCAEDTFLSNTANTTLGEDKTPPRPRHADGDMRTASGFGLASRSASVSASSSTSSEINNVSPEFIDCIELLNKAEKKVQNRFSPSLPSRQV